MNTLFTLRVMLIASILLLESRVDSPVMCPDDVISTLLYSYQQTKFRSRWKLELYS